MKSFGGKSSTIEFASTSLVVREKATFLSLRGVSFELVFSCKMNGNFGRVVGIKIPYFGL